MADIHIRNYQYHSEYKEVFKRTCEMIKNLLKDNDFFESRVVIVGDLFHQKITVSNEQILLGSWFIRELNKICPVIITAGNHDLLENNKSRMDSISPIIELLNLPTVKYYKESICYEDSNIIWCNYSIFEENKRPDIESFKPNNEIEGKHTRIGLYHAPITGATTDKGFSFDEHHTSLEHFEGCDIVMLGDIHKHQVFKHKNIQIVYPSSLIQQNYGESVKNHGFVLWDVESRTFKQHEVENNNSFYTFEVQSINDLENHKEIYKNGE